MRPSSKVTANELWHSNG